jgi:amino acid transporter
MILSLIWFTLMALVYLSGGGGAILSSRPFYNSDTFALTSLMGAASIAVLSFLGFVGISTLAEDARNGSRDISRATVLVCFICGGLFIGQTYLAQRVWPDYTTFSQVETAFMDVSRRVGGEWLFYFVSLALVVSGLGSSITGQASASRLLYGMGRDRLLPQRLFGYIHPKLGTPIYSVLLMGAVHLLGASFLKFGEAAEVINFGAFVGFIAVNLAVIRHYFLRLRQRSGKELLLNLVCPGLGFGICFYIWLNLSRFSLKLGAAWMALGFMYLLILTRGFRRDLGELKL